MNGICQPPTENRGTTLGPVITQCFYSIKKLSFISSSHQRMAISDLFFRFIVSLTTLMCNLTVCDSSNPLCPFSQSMTTGRNNIRAKPIKKEPRPR